MDKCDVCNEKNVGPEHFFTEKHKRTQSLKLYANSKSQLSANKKGIASVTCTVKSSFTKSIGTTDGKVQVSAKPDEEVVYKLKMSNESPNANIYVTSIQLLHSQFNFVLKSNNLNFGCQPQCLPPMQNLSEEITVQFSSSHIGQYETAIVFYFKTQDSDENIVIMRELVVYVEGSQTVHENIISPYERKGVIAKQLLRSNAVERSTDMFRVPLNCKKVYANGLKASENADQAERELAADIKNVLTIGVTKDNYIKFYHNILWYEETMIRLNVKRYNMSSVKLTLQHHLYNGTCYALVVPGLAEKRPSLMLGDPLFVKPDDQSEVIFEAVVKEINENVAQIGGFHELFKKYYSNEQRFDVRFFISRVPLERMHCAVHAVRQENQESRIFPEENKKKITVNPIINFFNPLVEGNLEQHCAVERIVSNTSGIAPYLLHGPPGTGKTVTIVEAILQLVLKNPENRIMVCTDSNMAADHVATMLIKYSHMFASENLLLRASSKFRVWETLPECLARFSNGTCRENFENVSIEEFMSYNIVVTTLSHAAKFAWQLKTLNFKHHITHLFIDEAAQASEPACLIPVCGLLKPTGALVLAGDPHQLGPVIISHNASKMGLGISLMERLKNTCPLYSDIRNDPNYVVMLRNNFRSNPDILEIPDKLFYKGQLRALATEDKISNIDILGEKQHSRAVVFHGVMSKEQKMGKSPSFFNMMECEIVQLYVKRLVMVHNVSMQDIGIVTPYIRQVYQIKKSLREVGFDKIEVGTVEAYQGKEKRIIIISTVRANCNLFDHDAKFQLGFLVDDKRFNVAVTRAKAKVIIIGNPLCLEKDSKWRMYIQRCRELGTYHGFDSSDMDNEGFQQIFDNVIPLLQGLVVNNNKRKVTKRK